MATPPLTDALQETLSVFATSGEPGEPLTTAEVTEQLDVSRRSTYARLERLAEHGHVSTKKAGARGRVWWRPPDATGTAAGAAGAGDARGEADATPADGQVASVLGGLVQSLPAMVYRCRNATGWPMSFVSEGCRDVSGYAAGDLEADRVSWGREVVHPEDRERVHEIVDEGLTEDGQFAIQYRIVTPDGETRWVWDKGRAVGTDDERAEVLEGIIVDVTAELAAGQTRPHSDAQFRALVEATEEYAIFMLDPEGHVTTWNPGAARIKGYEETEIVGEHFSAFYTETDREASVPTANLAAAAREGKVTDEGWRVRADGTRFWANVTISAIRDDDGALQGFAKVTRDMTERHRYEQSLKRERDLVDRLFETSPVGTAVFDDDLTLERVNDRLSNYMQYPIEEGETYQPGGLPLFDEDGERIPAEELPIPRVLETGEPVYGQEIQVRTSEENSAWIAVNASPIVDDGEVDRVVITVTDITTLKEQARQLERQRDEVARELEEVFTRVDDAVLAVDEDWQLTHVNGQARDLARGAGDLVGDPVWSAVPSLADDQPRTHLEAAMASQETVEFEHYADDLDAWLEVRLYPSESGLSVYTRNVTERVERQRELEESKRRYQTLVDNFPGGAVALVDEDLRYVTVGGTPVVENADAAADLEGETIRAALPTAVADVFEPRYRAALEGESSAFEYEADGGYSQVRVFPVRDENGEVFAAMGVSQDVTEQKERERQLREAKTQLEALNHLNGVVRDITEAAIDQSTRQEIEEVVCEGLAGSESYAFAWSGEIERSSREVTVRAEAGTGDYLDHMTITVDPDDPRSNGPTGRALRTGEVQMAQDIQADGSHDAWRDHVDGYDVRSSAAIPLVHDGTVFGVLNVYADRPNAFEGDEREVIGQLGEIVGHAIAAVERKQALMSDELVELEFRVGNVFDALGIDADPAGRIEIRDTVPIKDDEYLVYGTVTPEAVDTLSAVVDAIPYWEHATIHEGEGDRTFELRLSEPPVLSTLASIGGSVADAAIENGDYTMTLHVSPSADTRRLIDAVTDAYPTAEMLSRRQITRENRASERIQQVLDEELTDRQRTALRAAYHADFFAWPRQTTGEDLADALDVSPPTFHQHLRKAEQKVFESLLSGGETAVEQTG